MKKTFRIFIVILFVLILLAYFAGFYFFSNYYMPNTYVNGINLSYTPKKDLRKNYEKKSKDFKIKINYANGKEEISVDKFDYKDQLLKGERVNQNPIIWFLSTFADKNYELLHRKDYDREKFKNVVMSLKPVKSQSKKSVDAHIKYDGKNYVIVDEVIGDMVNIEKLEKEIISAFDSSNKTIDFYEKNLYYLPNITHDSESLQNKLKQLNHLNSFSITYDFEDRKEVLKGEKLVNMYRENEDGLMVPDVTKANEYIVELAKKYDTYKSTRVFNATGGFNVRIVGGIYGWLTDLEKSTNELVSAMEKTQDIVLKPVYKLDAISRKANDIGSSYVEIDLARQKTWVYKEGKLFMETDIVSGNPNGGNATPTGVGKIWSRETNRFLTGADYRSYVNFWLPFNWSGCGLHDANWRSRFGGNIYRSGGSHGCVNVPPPVMKKLYDSTFPGMPVIVYDSFYQKVS